MLTQWHITSGKNAQGMMLYYVSPPGYDCGFMVTTGEQHAKDWKREIIRDSIRRNLTYRGDLFFCRKAGGRSLKSLIAGKPQSEFHHA